MTYFFGGPELIRPSKQIASVGATRPRKRLGVRLEVTEVLNHITWYARRVAVAYQRQDWAAEKRAALDAWATHVRSIVEGGIDGTNVVKMPRN